MLIITKVLEYSEPKYPEQKIAIGELSLLKVSPERWSKKAVSAILLTLAVAITSSVLVVPPEEPVIVNKSELLQTMGLGPGGSIFDKYLPSLLENNNIIMKRYNGDLEDKSNMVNQAISYDISRLDNTVKEHILSFIDYLKTENII